MTLAKQTESGSTVRFIAVLAAVLAILVGVIEWTRRTPIAESPTPLSSESTALPFPREIRDASGERLIIALPPERIVSQTLATDEILLAICPSDRIVALSNLAEDTNYSNATLEAKSVAGRTNKGAEEILALRLDLIFVASYSRAETVQLLKASRAPVFRIANFDSIADIKNHIRTVGHALGRDEQSASLVCEMDEALAAVRLRVPPDAPAVRVMSFGQGGYTGGAKTTFDDMVRAAGAINVSTEQGIEGFAKISAEKIIEWQPDFIIAGASSSDMESTRKQMLGDPVIAASRAGRADKILIIDNRHLLTVSHWIVRGVEDLADGLYGKRN